MPPPNAHPRGEVLVCFTYALEKDADTSTTVYQVDGHTGAITGSTPAGTREIVGAGVSSCAPVVIE